MKTKKSIWSVALSLIIAFALVFGITLVNQPKSVKADVTYDGHITFDVRVDELEEKSVPAGYNESLTVTYTVTENTGVDALQLRLGYDHTAFTLTGVTTNNETALGEATKGKNGELDNDNVVFENVDTEGTAYVFAQNYAGDLLITATFTLKNPTPATAYTFSLYNVNGATDATIGYSKAWKIAPNAEEGHEQDPAYHNPVEILFANEAIVYVQGTYNFTLTGGSKTYDGTAVPNSAITITATGTNAPTLNLVWFDANNNKLTQNPTNVGTYYVVAETEGNDYWQAYAGYTGNANDGYTLTDVEGKVATYTITAQAVNVTIDNKSSAYGEALVELTHNGAEYLGINLSTTADNTVPGTYPITGTASNTNYAVTFTGGTYTITKKSVTVTIADKSSAYGEALAELTHNGAAALGVTLSTTATSSSNVGTYPITGNWTDKTNYDVTFVGGTYTITSVGKTADYVKSFFSGATLTFDAQEHNLLVVTNKPDWITYTASNNLQTDADTYQITVNITVSEQNAKNYIDATLVGDQNYVATVNGTINPHNLTVNAQNSGHVYGNTPATIQPQTVGLTDEVGVSFTVYKNYGLVTQEAITLDSSTNVGTYTIVPSATNTNYNFTFGTATYTVSKATPVLSLVALDTEYNNHFYFADASITVGNQVLEINGSSHENDYGFEYRIEIYNANNQKVLNDAWISENYWLDAGVYTAKLVLEGTDNYNGAVYQYISEDGFDTQFTIEKVLVGAPEIEYDGATATWSVVSKDTDNKDLHNSTVTYKIGGTEYANRSFTAQAKGTYTLVITPSNTNYMVNEVDLNPVYSVTFTEGTHTANTATPSNMPAVQYVFEGEQATQPATNPSLTGYTFAGWNFDFSNYIIEEMVVNSNGNLNIPALWTIQQRTIRVEYKTANGVTAFATFTPDYNDVVSITTANLIDSAEIEDMANTYDLNGMRYTFNDVWNYKVTGSEAEYVAAPNTVNATENYTFIAVYTATPINYEITYKLSIDGGEYAQYGEKQTVAYNSAITYRTLSNVTWFRADTWFTNETRTESAPANMPADNLTVYGAYVFNIGKGDVNGDGNINASDIILYRRWIVGGYAMTVVETGEEYELATSNNFNANGTYFLERVADTNVATYDAEVLGDNSTDIRDVSTIRMGMVAGYGFSIVKGRAVTGDELIIARDFTVENAADFVTLARSGAKVTLTQNITDETLDVEILNVENHDIIIDLHGHELTLKSFRVTLAEGNTGKILVTNGRVNVSDGNGVYLTAVDGSVHLDNVTLYDDNGLFVIQTADHSLHLFNIVRFLKRNIENPADPLPAEVLVVKDSHIVVEEQATLTIDKVVVAEIVTEIVEIEEEEQVVEHVVPVQEQSNAQITISNNSAQVAEVEVQGNVSYGISNYNELVEAAENGGEYTLFANIDCGNHDIVTSHNLTIDLNGYDITFAKWGFEVNNGATLTLNGDGNVTARACALYAQNGGKLVVNGGTYTSTNNPVIATHGNEGRGGNTITINGGEFNAGIITEGYVACGICTSNNDTVVVNAGTFNIENGVGIVARSGNTTVAENVVINITGNEIEGHILDSKHALIPSGKELVIDYASNYPGGTPVLTNNTEYEVYVVGNIVVTNEQELRTALANKVMAIVFGDDISSTDGYLVNYNTTIDLGGYTLTVTTGSSVNNRAIKVATGAELTVLNGTVDAQGAIESGCFGAFRAEVNSTLNLKDLTLMNYRSNGLNVKVLGANATLENVNITSVYGGGIEVTDDDGADGTVTGYAVLRNCVMTQSAWYDWCSAPLTTSGNSTLDVYSTSYTGDYGIYVFSSGGTINVYGGEFTATGHDVIKTSYDKKYGNDATVNIYGGSFTGTFGIGNTGHEFLNIYGGTFDHDPTAYIADKHYVENNNDVYTVKEYTKVATVDELYDALLVGGYIQLDADIIYSGSFAAYADTTINLNNYKLESVDNVAIWAWSDATLTFEGEGNVVAESACVVAYTGATVIINGGTFTSKDNFVIGTNGSTGAGANTIIINDGVFNGNIETEGYVACGIYVANNDTVTVNGGTFNITNGVGILARSGNTTVNNGVVFNVTGDGTLGKVGDSKVTVPSGEALVIDYAANYPGGTPTLTNNTSYTAKQIISGTGDSAQGNSGLED